MWTSRDAGSPDGPKKIRLRCSRILLLESFQPLQQVALSAGRLYQQVGFISRSPCRNGRY
jgi:hypothetical protein